MSLHCLLDAREVSNMPAESMIFWFGGFFLSYSDGITSIPTPKLCWMNCENINWWSESLSWNTLFWIGPFYLFNMRKHYQLLVNSMMTQVVWGQSSLDQGEKIHSEQQGWPCEIKPSVWFWFPMFLLYTVFLHFMPMFLCFSSLWWEPKPFTKLTVSISITLLFQETLAKEKLQISLLISIISWKIHQLVNRMHPKPVYTQDSLNPSAQNLHLAMHYYIIE